VIWATSISPHPVGVIGVGVTLHWLFSSEVTVASVWLQTSPSSLASQTCVPDNRDGFMDGLCVEENYDRRISCVTGRSGSTVPARTKAATIRYASTQWHKRVAWIRPAR
jgi:hypothetical protein